MGTEINRNKNSTTFVRCLKDEQHPYNLLPASIYQLDGYQFAIMAQILSNKDGWNIVKKEIGKRVDFPRKKFNDAWKSLKDLGYIQVNRIQRGYEYTFYDDINSTSTTDGICGDFTSTTGRRCTGGMLTNTKNNYYNREVTTTKDSICQENQFNELMELYPDTGTKSDGTIYKLKGKTNICKKAYMEYLNTDGMRHAEILTALRVELNERRMTGKTNYQPGLLKWIKARTFELYKERTDEPVEPGYGQSME
jgi:hypothetical protein